MGFFTKFFLFLIFVFSVYIGIQLNKLWEVPPMPEFDENTWWGPGTPKQENTEIKPFTINVPEEVLKDLERRLESHRPFVSPLEGIQHEYGLNTKLLDEIITYWKKSYKWREQEKFLNQYSQFTVNVQGLKIHFIHVKPNNAVGIRVLPLLLLHGWPGSVREFYEIIPHLITPRKGRDFVFELIIPSLPGYGFSDAPVRPGLNDQNMAILFKNFMRRIGFERFYVQGGDWGGIISQLMATMFPHNILGVHSNMCFVNTPLANVLLLLGSVFPDYIVEKEHYEYVYPLSKTFGYLLRESGYMHLQSTKPDTVGVALNDSPVGLAAYILEKFITWTNPKYISSQSGGLKEKFDYKKLLDNVMIYWVSQSITTSMRLYRETFGPNFFSDLHKIPIEVPSACARFRYELQFIPKIILKTKHKNLVHLSDFDGGHFAAFEAPELLADDIYEAAEKFQRIIVYNP